MPTLVDPAPPEMMRAPAHAPGDVLDARYRLVHRIGRGGFGDVWHAEELLPGGAPFRDVALKLLLPGGGDDMGWAEEAKLLASFRHASLVTIYSAGILATSPAQRFVAMELLEGQNLADLLRVRGRIPWRRVLRWAASTAAALDVIHAAGVVHLDLKPANLFLSADGELKVLDFGIARRAGSRAVLVRRDGRAAESLGQRDANLSTAMFLAEKDALAATRPAPDEGTTTQRAVIGTPGFMAPEVLECAEPTAAADAYALAVCIVQLATGRMPYAMAEEPSSWEDATAVSAWLQELRRATLQGALRDFGSDPVALPRGLLALLRRLLAVDPIQRGVAAGKLGAALDEVWERPHGVPEPPYFALSPYPPEAEGVLFGRDDDVARLGRELVYEPVVVLQGVRGAGKSSLAVAGLVPYLARRGVDEKDDWIAVCVDPGDDPDAALARALDAVSLGVANVGRDHVTGPPLAGASVAELAARCEASPVGLVLVIDPLEAVLAAPPETRRRFDALLVALAERTAVEEGLAPGLRVIAALAEEHAAELSASSLGASLRASVRFVGAPATAAVREIIEEPARFAGVAVTATRDLVAEVQRELRLGPARLPYVALALSGWWATREPGSSDHGSVLRGERWKDLGGVRGALVRHADRVFAALDLSLQGVAEELLLRLSATDGTPIGWAEGELCDTFAGSDRAAAERVLTVLAREHLVRRQGGAVEIGHEALLTAFPRLASARLHDMDRLAFLERLRDAALAWERADNHRDLLLHGALWRTLTQHPSWTVRGLSPRERELVDESRKRARFRAVARAAGVTAAVVALAGAVLANQAIDVARRDEANARAAAVELERIAELAAKARRSEDPFRRAAFVTAALDRGSTDGMLPLDLAGAVENLARAEFLSLDHIDGPAFPWDERWLIGQRSGTTLALVDFRSKEADVIEDVDLEADPASGHATHVKKPRTLDLRPHEDPIAERLTFAFDTAFVTRSVSGEVKVFRLRDDGAVLAAVAPFRCTGAVRLAEAAPVLACATDEGVARWDLRKHRSDPAHAVDRSRFQGNVADVSPDGARVAVTEGPRVLLWEPAEAREVVYLAQAPVVLAAWSPRDRALAVVQAGAFEIADLERPSAPLVRELASPQPVSVRWDPRGLDLAVCEESGAGRWSYLKRGGRAKDDALPVGEACDAPKPKGQPAILRSRSDYAEVARRDLGAHTLLGGFQLSKNRFLTRDLVLFAGAPEPAAARLLRFRGRNEIGDVEERGENDSAVAVERDEATVAWQIGGEVRMYSLADGSRLLTRRGNLLRRCESGRLLAWLVDGGRYAFVDVSTGATVATAPREPGIVVGADFACKTFYSQRLDGTLMASPLDDAGASREARAIAVTDGYVFDARPSPARGGVGAGLLIAVSSGAIARIDDASQAVRVLGYASPRAIAIADGPGPGDVAYTDAAGVAVLRATGELDRVLEASGEYEWSDLSVSPDGASMLLARGDAVAALDLARRELLGALPMENVGRLARWDDDGSVLAWTFDRAGGANGRVIPRGPALARLVSGAVSNLVVDKGRLSIRR